MASPFFTLVIPTFNRADRIGKTIATVLDQTFPDFELIVVDDGSADNTAEVIAAFKDQRIKFIQTANRERAAARNSGVRLATGAYVTFLDSDDLLYANHLMVAHQFLSIDHPEVYHQGYEIVNEARAVLSASTIHQPMVNALLFIQGNVMSCLGVFVRKDVAKANPFDETRALTGVEDWELWIRLASQYDIHHGQSVTAALVQHKGRSVSKSDATSLISRIDTFLRIVEENDRVRIKYKELLPSLRANAATYVSLHLSESGRFKKEALKFLVRGLSQSPRILFTKRTLAIFRNLLLR